mmetsp:Transcript_592/g.1418  ORF Transcript_592/g.1418 Transcript_592/m.1418 type:complete len:200 (+) Transcript_592:104-703(+)
MAWRHTRNEDKVCAGGRPPGQRMPRPHSQFWTPSWRCSSLRPSRPSESARARSAIWHSLYRRGAVCSARPYSSTAAESSPSAAARCPSRSRASAAATASGGVLSPGSSDRSAPTGPALVSSPSSLNRKLYSNQAAPVSSSAASESASTARLVVTLFSGGGVGEGWPRLEEAEAEGARCAPRSLARCRGRGQAQPAGCPL